MVVVAIIIRAGGRGVGGDGHAAFGRWATHVDMGGCSSRICGFIGGGGRDCRRVFVRGVICEVC